VTDSVPMHYGIRSLKKANCKFLFSANGKSNKNNGDEVEDNDEEEDDDEEE